MRVDTENIISLSEKDSTHELQEYLSSVTPEQLTTVITNTALKGKDIGALIKAFFKGSPPSLPNGVSRRALLYQHCISLCDSGDLQTEVASDIMGLLMLETHSLPGPSLAQLSSLYVDAIKAGKMGNGKSLELFPTILTALAGTKALAYGKGELSGEEYKKQLINTLCSSRWDPQYVIHLTTMFRDVPLSPEELQFVIEKVLRMFEKLELQEIPPLIYQLLLLSSKGCKKQMLEGIIRYFEQQDEQQKSEQIEGENLDVEVQSIPQDQLRHVEGTAILHIVFAVRLDHELGKEFLKTMKASLGEPSRVLCSFSIAQLLSLSRIQRLEEQVFDFLKGSIIKCFKDEQVQQGSKFLQDLVAPPCSVSTMILETVKNSVFGWDHVTQGLVQLGFILMDSFGPKPGPFGKTAEAPSSSVRSPTQLACQLGGQILLEGFKMHEQIRGEILEQVLNRLVTKTASPVTHFIDLLSSMVTSAPMILLESSPKVMETFDQLSYLPLSTVEGLLKAVQPLLKVSMALKDSLIIVLRKAMFSSQLDGRKSAVLGFLLLLKNFRVLGSVSSSQASQAITSSQIQADVHSRYNAAANEAFCLEILSSLRRCLSQQADVRIMLYEDFHDVLRRNSKLASSIMQTLLSQLRRYYEPEQDLLPPLKLEPCISAQGDHVFLQEPLSHLLSCTVHCLLWYQGLHARRPNTGDEEDDDDDEDEGGFQTELQTMLESVTRRMVKSELEDFELDKSAEFSMASSVGVRNSIFAALLMGLYEVLIEYNFTSANYNKNRFEELLQLFSRYQKLCEIVKEKAGKSRASSKAPRSLLSLGFISSLLYALFRDSTQSREESLAVLRGSADFMRYAVGVTVHKIQQLEETGHTDGPDGHHADKAFHHLCDITSVLMWRYTNVPPAAEDAGKKTGSRSVSVLCLEGLLRVFTTVQQRHPTRLAQLLGAIDVMEEEGGEAGDGLVEKLSFYLRQFQRSLMTQLSGSEEDFSSREAQLLVGVLAVLSCRLESGSPQLEQMITWTLKICKETSFEDVALTKGLLSLLFSLLALQRSPVAELWELCQDIHSQLGDIDQDVELEKQSHFNIVCMKTAAPTTLLVLAQVGRLLDEVDWLITQKKTQAALDKGNADLLQATGQQDRVLKAVTLQLGTLLTALHELLQSALPPGACTDTLLRDLSRTYGLLTSLLKYYIQLCASHQSQLPSRLEKLVKLSGSHLTPQCYNFITYVQSGEGSGGAEKKKKKKEEDAMVAASAKVLRQTKVVPNLIFSIEQYEKFLILLSKKSKVNLMQYMKLTTSRDFRINAAALDAVLQEQQDPDSQQTTATQTPEQSQEPKKKKRKV
ncbi:Fanconi anemia group I protein [Clupea harengus]|uniref:Fanconi anemia group I protein n=1 Tax=Clupea harengus TaxID=7950 RepID=A0A6P8FB27_CLUHA|nr:Fanconi anemia group I protein [Clupea harengus]XP_031420965.1 Fanconi anemia group I protein [Clupea harengus]XP_031420966.1 Fanconi anemia group I protein [Clupea harengus]